MTRPMSSTSTRRRCSSSSSRRMSRPLGRALPRVGRGRLSPRDPRSPAAVAGGIAGPARRVPVPVALHLLPRDRDADRRRRARHHRRGLPAAHAADSAGKDVLVGKAEARVRRATKLFTVSQAARAALVERFGLREDRVTVVPEAPAPPFRPRAGAEVETALAALGLRMQSYFLFAGGISPHKNLETLLDAYSKCVRPETRHRRSCSWATSTTTRTSRRPIEYGDRSRRWSSRACSTSGVRAR